MRGERRLLCLGEYLVRRACQQLPADIREERYREWAAELPAILHDLQVRFAPWRAVRMLGFAADAARSAAPAPGGIRGWTRHLSAALDLLMLLGCLVAVASGTRLIVQTPGSAQGYLALAWALPFAAYFIIKRVRPAGRMTAVLLASGIPGIVAWNVAQGPGDWVNYFLAALLGLALVALLLLGFWFLVLFLVSCWLRIRRPAGGGYNARHSK
jgi:hypothetical protein